MPSTSAAASSASFGRGQTATMRGTPATCAGTTVITSVETSAKRPPGIAPDGFQGADDLGDGYTRLDLQLPFAGQLLFRHTANIPRGVRDRAKEFPADTFLCR